MRLLTVNAINFREQALRTLGQLPPFSPVLNKVLATLADDDVSFGSIAELIEKDTVLSGYVLRLVNSALYGHRGTVNSVRHAVSLMGLVKLRNTVLSLSISRMWTHLRVPPSWSATNFNRHSVATGILADLLAQRIDVDYAEGAFVGGLLHDIGKLLIALGLPAEHEEIARIQKVTGRPMHECEEEVLGITHPKLSAAALARWNIPVAIQEAVSSHHDVLDRPQQPFALGSLVQLADAVTNAMGIRCGRGRNEPPGDAAPLLDAAGVGRHTEWVLEQFEAEYAALKNFF
jgi:putative nucleotidyltransferase with HDIG domain